MYQNGEIKKPMYEKWYLHTWVICLLFALWPCIFPPIIGVILLIMQEAQNKQIAERLWQLENRTGNINMYDTTIQEKEDILNQKNAEINDLNAEIEQLKKEILVEYSDVHSYDSITSDECKNKLQMLKLKQEDCIKSNKALLILNADSSKKAIENNKKQILRCFNSESSSLIESITIKNVDSIRQKITKSFDALNKIFSTDGVAISKEFLELRLEELSLVYAYQVKKEEEKEQQKAIREQLVEEEKVRREIEKEKQKIEKEETQFQNEISKLIAYMNKSKDEVQIQLYADKIRELDEKLKLLEKDKENVLQREQNTRAGFVYVISNIGSFGENVFKIGMTRRLDPLDRINELSSASVPFSFDVHAMIFSDDAPTLENELHKQFDNKRVNKVNSRKEFFKVTLKEIENVVKEHHSKTVEFTEIASADDYRQSLIAEKDDNKQLA